MKLTIVDLARAVNRSETYVRQHVHRKHLAVRREGRNVYVPLDEAERWAHERGLNLVLPTRVAVATDTMQARAARMTVLAWCGPGDQVHNMFTLIRHRRHDSLGPWDGEPSEKWSSDDLGHDIRLFRLDAPLSRCQEHIHHILNSGALEINGLGVRYSLAPVPRCHWAYRDSRPHAEVSVVSPFSRHSAEVTEYWSFTEAPRKHWLDVVESLPPKVPRQFSSIGFPLHRRPDRVGNLMIASAHDAIACDLKSHRDGTLRLHIEAEQMLTEAYHAMVWARHSGDDVLRKGLPIAPGETMVQLPTDVDHVGCAVYRSSDGQCVDLMEYFLIMEVRGFVHLDSGPSLQVRDRKRRLAHTISPAGVDSEVSVSSDKDSSDLDKGIRQLNLERQMYEQESAARKDGNFARFGPSEFDEARQYIVSIMRQAHEQHGPIYLADPYFMKHSPGGILAKLYLDMFAATRGRELRVMCAHKGNVIGPPWWSGLPSMVTSHVSVRSFAKHGGDDPVFHDRYLITPDREIIITNSFNGWSKHGVTFAQLPYGVYRAEAELLWFMPIGSAATLYLAREIG